MFDAWGLTLSREELSMLLDGLLILIMLGLWWLWWQQSQHRKKIETNLSDAASQLQQATLMLDEALHHIERLQQHEIAAEPKATPVTSNAPAKTVNKKKQAYAYSGDKDAYSPTGKKTGHVSVPQESSQAAQILRMQREGETAEQIAKNLNMPLAQVKLMLMLHKNND